MTLKKRMFYSNMRIMGCALTAFFLVALAVVLFFKEPLSKGFESLDGAQLDAGVMQAAACLDAAQNETDWDALARELKPYGYELLIEENGDISYGIHKKQGQELLHKFVPENHKSGQTELYYVQGTTIAGRYNAAADCYMMAVGGTEEEWWLIPIRRSGPMLPYMLMVIGGLVTLMLFCLSGVFTRLCLAPLTEPLDALERAARRVQEGNLTEQIVYQGDAEFEEVCRTFNTMQLSLLESRRQQERYEKARTDMVTGISHDLRTPLTAIRGYIKGILDGVASTPEKQKRYLETAYEATGEMNVLLQKLFDFSRMESGQMPFHMIKGDLAELAEGWVAGKESEPDGETVQFHFERGHETMAEIQMDIDQIWRFLTNLLENSRKYAGKTPVNVYLRVDETDSDVYLEWWDDGHGVPSEKLPHLFERFYRCDEARKTRGSGVGLYVVKWIVERHGGRVEAENRGGLMIRLWFPKGE